MRNASEVIRAAQAFAAIAAADHLAPKRKAKPTPHKGGPLPMRPMPTGGDAGPGTHIAEAGQPAGQGETR